MISSTSATRPPPAPFILYLQLFTICIFSREEPPLAIHCGNGKLGQRLAIREWQTLVRRSARIQRPADRASCLAGREELKKLWEQHTRFPVVSGTPWPAGGSPKSIHP